MSNKCSCCGDEPVEKSSAIVGEYVCYCDKVTEQDIRTAVEEKGASSVEQVIKLTGAMTNCNCKVNNPKGVCCYPDIIRVFKKYCN